MLMHALTDEQCANLFPKEGSASAQSKDRIKRLNEAVKLSSSEDPSTRTEAHATINTILGEQVQADKNAKGLRLDIHLVFPDKSERGIDVGTTHHLKKGTLNTAKNWFLKKHALRRSCHLQGISLPRDQDASPAVNAVVLHKTKKYKPLFDYMQAQRFAGQRRVVPSWLACIISNVCEFSPDVFKLVEQVTLLHKRKYLDPKHRPLDGHTPNRAAARFRTHFKDTLACEVARGYGNMILSTAVHAG